jgi:hypothetical protein
MNNRLTRFLTDLYHAVLVIRWTEWLEAVFPAPTRLIALYVLLSLVTAAAGFGVAVWWYRCDADLMEKFMAVGWRCECAGGVVECFPPGEPTDAY